ncbi:lipopolysaccharide biosynthesis protein [Nakamurella leprariae]|uniref:Lipopolysaccharide biosynthesis protein n=1 Tax=Nakamurella leprariae TaxID=2803911 RepID=A0A939C0T7_9ACTN|nr:lipopolysaccharide biosynthesis protein [Nakamurella leprariae]MBM9469121.1 lipopolysaccharide biosynthesis protein [Nakamurella leprariae]
MVTHRSPPKPRSRLTRQFGLVASGRIVGAVIQALSLALLARWAGPDDFGVASVMFGLIIVLQVATDLGIPTFVLRQRAADRNDPTVTSALRINSRTALALCALVALVIVVGAMIDSTFWSVLPLAVWAAADRNTDTWLGVALADGDAQVNATVGVARRVLSCASFILLVLPGVPPLLAFSAGYAVVSLAINVAVHRWVRHRLVADTRTPFRTIVGQSFAYWVNSVGTQLRNLDTLIVGTIAGSSQTAYYAAAARVTGPLRIVPTSLATVLVPAVARGQAEGAGLRPVMKTVGVVVGMMALIYGALAALAPVAVPLLLGEGYRDAVLPFQIVVISLVLAGLASNLGGALQGLGRKQFVAMVSVISTALCLAGVAIGSISSGAVGAAIALAASFALQAVLLGIALARSGCRAPAHMIEEL